jgi:hypothetical protein
MPKPTSAMTATPAKHVPTYKIIFANFPSATSNPKAGWGVSGTDKADPEADRAVSRCESAVEMGVERMLPMPLVNIQIPRRVVFNLGLSSCDVPKVSTSIDYLYTEAERTGNRFNKPGKKAGPATG